MKPQQQQTSEKVSWAIFAILALVVGLATNVVDCRSIEHFTQRITTSAPSIVDTQENQTNQTYTESKPNNNEFKNFKTVTIRIEEQPQQQQANGSSNSSSKAINSSVTGNRVIQVSVNILPKISDSGAPVVADYYRSLAQESRLQDGDDGGVEPVLVPFKLLARLVRERDCLEDTLADLETEMLKKDSKNYNNNMKQTARKPKLILGSSNKNTGGAVEFEPKIESLHKTVKKSKPAYELPSEYNFGQHFGYENYPNNDDNMMLVKTLDQNREMRQFEGVNRDREKVNSRSKEPVRFNNNNNNNNSNNNRKIQPIPQSYYTNYRSFR